MSHPFYTASGGAAPSLGFLFNVALAVVLNMLLVFGVVFAATAAFFIAKGHYGG